MNANMAAAVSLSEVKRKLQDNEYSTQRYKGKSDVWDTFDIIVDGEGKKVGAAQCTASHLRHLRWNTAHSSAAELLKAALRLRGGG